MIEEDEGDAEAGTGGMQARPALRHYRAILMKTKNRYDLGSWE